MKTFLTVACAVALAHAPAAAQVANIKLRAADATLDHEFTAISSVRELSDGRVLVTDEKENAIVIADFRSRRASNVARKGNGPGEFRQVGRLWPMGGDSTLMADPFARRWLVFSGDRIVATRSPNLGRVESGQLLGMDREGRATYAMHSFNKAGKLTGLRDSMYVIRIKPGGRTDTLARIPSEHANFDPAKPPAAIAGLAAGATTPRIYKVNLFPWDQVITFADGWTAIARTIPYRVDWCASGTRCAVSPAIPEQPARVTTAEKRAYIQHMVRTSNWRADVAVSDVSGWPEIFPPFAAKVSRIDASPLIAMPDGRVVIERIPTAASPGMRYDIVDRRGVRVAHVALPVNQQIVGFGARSVYVAVIDEDNIQRLQRHPWP